MTVQVVAKRFVNTPTVLEVYKEEHPDISSGVDQDQVDKLSEEYDQVTGNESYSLYRTLFEHLPRPNASREGTEGFFEWVKDTIQKLIEGVKAFFKWIWGLVSSKQKALELKVNDLKDKIKKYGVKTTPTKYPKAYMDLWGDSKQVPFDLHWMVTALGNVKTKIGHCDTYIKSLDSFLDHAKGWLRPGYIYESRSQFESAVHDLSEKTASTFTNGEKGKVKPFMGVYTVTVDTKGGVYLSIDSKLAGGRNKTAEFTTTVTEANSVVDVLDKAFNEMDTLNKQLGRLETAILKDLEEVLKTTGDADHGKHTADVKVIVDTLKDITTTAMAAVKNIEQGCYKPLTVATAIINASLAKG